MLLHRHLVLLLLVALAAKSFAADGNKPSYADVVEKMSEEISKASERAAEIVDGYMDEVSKDPGQLITKEALKDLVDSNTFLPQKAGTRTIRLEGTQGFNGITNYEPSGWKIQDTMAGPTKDEEDEEEEEKQVYSYPSGLGPVLLNQCTGTNYSESSPCYNTRRWFGICEKFMDAAAFIGVGFDGRGYYSPMSRKFSLIQRPCYNKASFLSQHVPDNMNIFGIFHTVAETKSFQSVDEYMDYIAQKAGLSKQKGLFTSEASKQSKASSFGFNGGALGTLIGGGIGAAAGGPAGAMLGATLGGAIGGSIEGGYGEGSGSSSSTESGTSNSSVEQTESSTTDQGSTQNFFAMMFVKIILYDLTLDEVKPTDLSLNFLKDYMDLPVSYYSIGAEVDYQKFIIRWGTHFIRSGLFGGQLKVTKTMKTDKKITAEEFAEYSEKEFKSMFSTLQSSYVQKSGGGSVLGFGGKEKSASQESSGQTSTEYSSEMNSENRQSQDISQSEYTQTSVEAEGGSPTIAEALMDFYTPAFKQLFHDWIVSIKGHVKPFDFQLRSIHELLDMRLDALFPAGDLDFGCMNGENSKVEIKVENGTNKRFYFDTRVKSDGSEVQFKVYCKYDSLDDFMNHLERRRLSLERAINVYMVEGPFPTSSFELPPGEIGCEEKVLTQIDLFSNEVIPYSELLAQPFLLVMNLRQDIPGLTGANAKYKMQNLRGFWFTSEPENPHANLYDGCKVPGQNTNGTKICFENSILTYDESLGFFSVDPSDFQWMKEAMPSLPNWLSGALVARPERLQSLSDVRNGVRSDSIAVPCNVKWINSHRLDPNRDVNCIHFTAASQGDIFVVLAAIPKQHSTWRYVQISPDGVSFYKGFNLQKRDASFGIGLLGDANLFQSFFVCVSQADNKLILQYGKADADSEVGVVYSVYASRSDNADSKLSYYSFGSGDSEASLMDVRLTEKLPRVECVNDVDYKIEDGGCVLVCHDECDGCSQARDNKACHLCKNMRVQVGTGASAVIECIAECPAAMEPSSSSQQLCEECQPGTFKNESGNQPCSKCPTGQKSSAGASVCTPCESGTFASMEGSVTCHPCSPGTSSSVVGATSCTNCSWGTFSPGGQPQCDPCPLGHFADEEGLQECKACEAGTYTSVTGEERCRECPAGTDSSAGSATCDNNCEAGWYSPREGVDCMPCPAGSFSGVAGMSSCTGCSAGFFQPDEGKNSCIPAEEGHYVPGVNATQQLQCGVGHYMSSTGSIDCIACPVGKFADQPGAAECTDCPENTVAVGIGFSTCTSCESLQYSDPGSQFCSTCPPFDVNSENEQCYKKLEFASCGQSSQWQDSDVYICNNAMNGHKTGDINDSPSCSVTESESGAYWYADFASPVSLYHISLVSSFSDLSESTNIRIEVFDGELWRFCNQVSEQFVVKGLGCRVKNAVSVRIRKMDEGRLALCEVTPYGLVIENTEASSCSVGSYSPDALSGSCAHCPDGTYMQTDGAINCINCAVGYFADSSRSSSCTACPANTFAPEVGSNSCLECLTRHMAEPGSYSCSVCPALSISDINSLCYKKLDFSDCSLSGIWQSQNPCINAMDDFFSRDMAADPSCSVAYSENAHWIGEFASPVSLHQLVLLSPQQHTYEAAGITVEVFDGQVWRFCDRSSDVYESKVIDCHVEGAQRVRVQRTSPSLGYLTLCDVTAYGLVIPDSVSSCPEGYYIAESGSSICSPCPAGSYSDSKSTKCQLCGAGEYSELGATSCIQCPSDHAAAPGSAACTRCDDATKPNADRSQCENCHFQDPNNYSPDPLCYEFVPISHCSSSCGALSNGVTWDSSCPSATGNGAATLYFPLTKVAYINVFARQFEQQWLPQGIYLYRDGIYNSAVTHEQATDYHSRVRMFPVGQKEISAVMPFASHQFYVCELQVYKGV